MATCTEDMIEEVIEKCANCNKDIYFGIFMRPESWRYRCGDGYLCSWSCLCAYRRKMHERGIVYDD